MLLGGDGKRFIELDYARRRRAYWFPRNCEAKYTYN